jgi:squalene-hopene/tetraprenyl-beta-curcumene cyclase
MALDRDRLDAALSTLIHRLLDRRTAPGHWDGHLANSALSTATAVLALHTVENGHALRPVETTGDATKDRLGGVVRAGSRWLLQHQNPDGGWGDTVCSRSNISTTAIVWATLSKIAGNEADVAPAIERSGAWLRRTAGDITPGALRSAILRRYGKDRTFSVPILTVLALTGKLGEDARVAWRLIPQLPFELAAVPHTWFQHLRLPVVSYALPALIAMGQARHHFAPTRNPIARTLRGRVRGVTHRLLRAMQPESGGYLEATPLTSFVVMSLAGMGQTASPVVEEGVRFLVESMRDDGGWPIDTNLSTWVTTLSITALEEAGALPARDIPSMQTWLLAQQSTKEHPFTHAAPGGWAWTPLSGGVPDADDTSGALLALRRLGDPDPGDPDPGMVAAASAGVRWLIGVQNRDGGVPTFCRGWGALPFDRSTPEITAHALQAWSVWWPHVDPILQRDVRAAGGRAMRFLADTQRPDGAWIPLWFGNEHAPGEENPAYGTARVLLGLYSATGHGDSGITNCRRLAVRWLLEAQNTDGGWGGSRAVPSSIEETGIVLAALGHSVTDGDECQIAKAVARGAAWLLDATRDGAETAAAPLGLYFARLWYYEELYPVVFALAGLSGANSTERDRHHHPAALQAD